MDYLARTGNSSIESPKFGSLDSLYDPIKLGKAALKATNVYREQKGKKPLVWSQPLCAIGAVHSKNMAQKKVPFGHSGFKKRVNAYPFPHLGAAENVAYHSKCSSVVDGVVSGWIRSPGHEKNLVSDSTYCGIGVYEASNGCVYFTQLFATTSFSSS
mmetsp:Transcript_423/g.778  ORF Transcript_423/g.778 Transcript_423/m.778 type:complete len:157 (-) Transcript_423:38-508(-)